MARSALLICSLSLFGVACGATHDAGTPGGGDDKAVTGDPTGGDDGPGCPDGEILNAHGQCIKLCQKSEDCADASLVCNLDLGVCVPAPEPVCDPSTCQTGYTCPPAGQGTDCVPLPAGGCNVDGDCGILERCSAGECISRAGDVVKTCTVDGDCPLLMTCQVGVCLGCVNDLQCSLSQSGSKCVLGTCVTADLGAPGECINKTCPDGQKCALTTGQCTSTCTVDTDCADTERCLPVGNYCVAKFGCTQTSDCSGLLQCIAGLCVGCTDDSQCLASEKCIKAGTMPLGACFPNLTGNVCDTVTCETPGDICDPANGSCYPSNGTCADASDCRPNYSCNFLHLCSGCSVDGDCRPNQTCLLSTCIPTNVGG